MSKMQLKSSVTTIVLTAFLIFTASISYAQVQVGFFSDSTGEDGALEFSSPPTPRGESGLVFDSNRDVMVLFGGLDVNAFTELGDTWEWNGTRWNNVTGNLSMSPTERSQHAMVYDSDRNVVVLFGGVNQQNQLLNDTWEFNGTTWTNVVTSTAPTPRYRHAMAYDNENDVIVLFGGNDGSRKNDTWEYNGVNWTLRNTSTLPPIRDWHRMVFDDSEGRKEVVMFGGFSGSIRYRDTWVYDGSNWTERTPGSSPPERDNHSMYYDSDQDLVYLFGGFLTTGNTRSNDLWSWNGNTWSQVFPATTNPSARNVASIAYDSNENETLLFGGFIGVSGPRSNDTWIWDGTDWSMPLTVQGNAQFDMRGRENGVWNFTTINIESGVNVTFIPNTGNTPVVWLAADDVLVDGRLLLNGEAGPDSVLSGNEAKPGPGGFAGGLGGTRSDISGTFMGTGGKGPGGGSPGISSGQFGGHAGHATAPAGQLDGNAYGSIISDPIVGGSGGGGGASDNDSNGGNGGAGGGAILIASSTTITVNGEISARGGAGKRFTGAGDGGNGSGGTIRLVANEIIGNGELDVGTDFTSSNGRIRVEAFNTVNFTPAIPFGQTVFSSPPVSPLLNQSGIIEIIEISGSGIPAFPSGNTQTPDIVFEESGPVNVLLATQGIPEGTNIVVIVSGAGMYAQESAPTDASGNANVIFANGVPVGVGTIQAFAEY